MEKFWQALAALMPTGFAWPRDPNSTLMRVLRALAQALHELHEFTRLTVAQWQPHQTITRLAEWEEATGLPDACFDYTPATVPPGRYPGVTEADVASFARIGPATYIDAEGVLRTALPNQPRFDHDPVTLAPLGLLVEAAGANLLSFSEQLDNPVWVSNTITRTPNAALAPDGTMTADKLSAIGSDSYLYQIYPVGAGVPCVYSIWLRADVPTTISLIVRQYPSTIDVQDLAVAVGTAWARHSISLTTIPGTTQIHVSIGGDSGFSTGEEVYPWGAQLELGSAPTSYIPTTSAPAIRAADVASRHSDYDQVNALRRKLLLARLRGPVLAYDDSSPASPGAIVAICAWLGYVATVAYNTPFRCGDRVGDRLGALDGRLYVTVTIQSIQFRVGISRVGDRLLQGTLNGGELACYLERVVPARYQLNVIFV